MTLIKDIYVKYSGAQIEVIILDRVGEKLEGDSYLSVGPCNVSDSSSSEVSFIH